MAKITIKNGLKEDLPNLNEAEMGFTTDEKRVYIGSDEGNIAIANKSEFDKVKEQLDHFKKGYKKGSVIDSFSSINDTWSMSTGIRKEFDENGKLKVTFNSSTSATINKAIDVDLTRSKVVTIKFFVENASNFNGFQLYLVNDTNWVGHSYVGMWNGFFEGWNTFSFDLTKFVSNGVGSTANPITSIQIVAYATDDDSNVSITFDSLTRDETQKPSVLFHFDDGWSSQYYEAFKYMHRYGLKGSIAVVPTFVDAPSYMTIGQLQEMHHYNWDMMNHTWTHPDLSTLTPAQIKSELDQTEAWLNNHGFTEASDIVIYPFGGYNQNVLDYVSNKRAGRSVIETFEAGAPNDVKRIKVKSILNTTPLADLKGNLDEVINTGGTVIYLFHHVSEVADEDMKYSTAQFRELVDYVYSKRDQVDVLTTTEYLDKFNL